MERRVRGNAHARCEVGENLEIISKSYLSQQSIYPAYVNATQGWYTFLIDGIREYTKPLFSIPTHQFLFNAGNINPREYMDALQIEESEFDLIKFPERGVCLFKCGNERYLLQVIAPEYKAALFGKAGGR